MRVLVLYAKRPILLTIPVCMYVCKLPLVRFDGFLARRRNRGRKSSGRVELERHGGRPQVAAPHSQYAVGVAEHGDYRLAAAVVITYVGINNSISGGGKQ